MKKKTNNANYTTLWKWIREREAIRHRKEVLGVDPPWTDDPILSMYRFCNVRREDDRVTRWIAENVRRPFRSHPLLWFMLCVCRQINWPDTLAELIVTGGSWPSHGDFSLRKLGSTLNDRRARGEKIYTGAYMIPAPEQAGADKQMHIATIVLGDLYRRAGDFSGGWEDRTLQSVHTEICKSSGWGQFLAYQAVVDMRFCRRLLRDASDTSTWAAAGPGTIRGLNRVHGRPVDAGLSQAQALHEMRAIYRIVTDETGVQLDFSDVPNVLCETDKYLRVELGQGKPRAKYVPGRGA